jgi:prephenate dehydratase
MADGQATGSKKGAPRIAYSGEEYGFGYQATEVFVESAKGRGSFVNDAGATRQAAQKALDVEVRSYDIAPDAAYDFRSTQRMPLRAKEQALLAVKMYTADFAVVPFYNPYAGYDFETLRALNSQFGLLAVEQYEATDKFCLAVYEPQVLDLVQSAHPASGLSGLLKKERRLWNDTSVRPDARYPQVHDSGEQFRSGLEIDRSAQLMLRDRIDMVFCGPEAARRCKSRLDGLRAAGIEVSETLRSVEPHREMAHLARATLNPNRQTNTIFDPRTGQTSFVSTMNAEPQNSKLYGVVLPFQIAMMSQDFTIIDDDMEDAAPAKTRFFVVGRSVDKSLVEDAYKTTDARTRYWMNRLRNVAVGPAQHTVQHFLGNLMLAGGFVLFLIGLAGLAGFEGIAPVIKTTAIGETQSNVFAFASGAALLWIGFIVKLLERSTQLGVRMMLKFERNEVAASLGDVENFLRNYGVRHQVVRMDEDSEGKKPAAMVLDVEFAPEDFRHDPISMVLRRLRGSVVNGALKKAFARWKQRAVFVLAAMPIERDGKSHALKFQMPPHKRRTWYWDAPKAWAMDFIETMQIRFTRVLLWLAPLALVAYAAYKYWRGDVG